MSNVFDKPCTFDEAWDSRDYLLEECWNCGGEGYVAHCEDEGACLHPEDGCDYCTRRCEYCNPAQAIEAAKPARRETGSTEGESAVVADDAPTIGMGKSDQEGA